MAKAWYWGRGRLGPLSLVWFWTQAPDGTQETGGYVARDGQVLTASCNGVTVRPTGANDVFPPAVGDSPPGGFHISAEIEGDGTLEVDVTHHNIVLSLTGAYYRWTGTLSGGFGKGTNWTGPALYEQLTP